MIIHPHEIRMPLIGERVGSGINPGCLPSYACTIASEQPDLKLIGRSGIVLMNVQWNSLYFFN